LFCQQACMKTHATTSRPQASDAAAAAAGLNGVLVENGFSSDDDEGFATPNSQVSRWVTGAGGWCGLLRRPPLLCRCHNLNHPKQPPLNQPPIQPTDRPTARPTNRPTIPFRVSSAISSYFDALECTTAAAARSHPPAPHSAASSLAGDTPGASPRHHSSSGGGGGVAGADAAMPPEYQPHHQHHNLHSASRLAPVPSGDVLSPGQEPQPKCCVIS
jgi:hypothetical protein